MAVHGASVFFLAGSKAFTFEGEKVDYLVQHFHRRADRIADEAFYGKIRQDRCCEGECTEGGNLNGFGVLPYHGGS